MPQGSALTRGGHASIRVRSRPAEPRRPCRAPLPAAEDGQGVSIRSAFSKRERQHTRACVSSAAWATLCYACAHLRQARGRPGAVRGEVRHLVSRARDGDGQHRLRLALLVRRRVQQQLPLRMRLWRESIHGIVSPPTGLNIRTHSGGVWEHGPHVTAAKTSVTRGWGRMSERHEGAHSPRTLPSPCLASVCRHAPEQQTRT